MKTIVKDMENMNGTKKSNSLSLSYEAKRNNLHYALI